ncbi:MAG: DUF6445 family protein [Parasphingorhabdus sp.]
MTGFDDRISTQAIGREQNRIAFVHDVFQDPDSVISLADTAKYTSKNKAYPGVRSPVDKDIAILVKSAITAAVKQLLPDEISRLSGGVHYSIVTQRSFDSLGIVRRPHSDDSTGRLIAAVLYLNRGPHGGTGFFRHQGTGFELITRDRKSFYDTVVKVEQNIPADMEDSRSGVDHPRYTRIATAKPVFNSMVVYPGAILHSGDIDRIAPIPLDARNGRLTINAFFTPALRNEDLQRNSA